MGFAHMIDQVDQLGVNLILKQRSAGRGATRTHFALVDQHRLDALSGKPVRHQRAGNAAADDRHIADFVFLKGWIGCQKSVLDRPVSASRA